MSKNESPSDLELELQKKELIARVLVDIDPEKYKDNAVLRRVVTYNLFDRFCK